MDVQSNRAKAQSNERLDYIVAEAGALLGISRAFAYELVARGELSVIRFGRRRLVPKVALFALVEAQRFRAGLGRGLRASASKAVVVILTWTSTPTSTPMSTSLVRALRPLIANSPIEGTASRPGRRSRGDRHIERRGLDGSILVEELLTDPGGAADSHEAIVDEHTSSLHAAGP